MTKSTGFIETYFYFCMSLLITAVVVFGFSHTVEQKFFHPVVARPLLLYVHVSVFSSWLIFYIIQSGLVRMRNVRLHRRLGWFGVALGVAIPVMGVSTAITMARFNIARLHATFSTADLFFPFFDMIAFTITFALAIYWVKRPEFHRRLILVASCALTSAAFARFPPQMIPSAFFYAGVDFLILLGVTRDLIVDRRIHVVYLCCLPAFIVGQTIVMYISTHDLPILERIARTILG